jgi:hypothetical protein
MGLRSFKVRLTLTFKQTVLMSVSLVIVHDFFTPQPVKQAAVFLLRVVLHDWPDNFARRILLRLREAAMPTTKLLLGDFILPLACPDETEDISLEGIEGIESALGSPPLLSNLGKASANAYWMDMTVRSYLLRCIKELTVHIWLDASSVQRARENITRDRCFGRVRWLAGHEGHDMCQLTLWMDRCCSSNHTLPISISSSACCNAPRPCVRYPSGWHG